MIFLNKNAVNKVVLTLDESSRLSNPYYLFHFKNDYNMDDTGIYYYTPDLSNSRCRYNLFDIVEDSINGSITGGFNVPLKLISGQYTYRVYESTTPTIVLSETTQRIVEEGRMVVDFDETNNSIYN